MNRISAAFQHKKPILAASIMGGYPTLEFTNQLLELFTKTGVDLIEISIPFSDPTAEGPEGQEASEKALQAGCTVDGLFDTVKDFRRTAQVPIVFKTYANPVFAYGTAAFLERCRECGIDGVVMIDVPYEEKQEFSPICKEYGTEFISMMVPAVPERVTKIASEACAFLYCTPSLQEKNSDKMVQDVAECVATVHAQTQLPCLVDANAVTQQQVKRLAEFADGVMIGTQITALMNQNPNQSLPLIEAYLNSIRSCL